MKTLRSNNSNKLIFVHININLIRNKFQFLSSQVKGNINALIVSEIKIDNSFPIGNFAIDGFSTPCRLDCDGDGGAIIQYVREDIPADLSVTGEKKHI